MMSCSAGRLEHSNLPPGHPARVGYGCDGRFPDLRIGAPPSLPSRCMTGQWHVWGCSPLTVAGAATDLAGVELRRTVFPFASSDSPSRKNHHGDARSDRCVTQQRNDPYG